jgi:predicted transcriptional regulator
MLFNVITSCSKKEEEQEDMKQRSRNNIIRDILDAASSGSATRTKIMYKAYLSSGHLKEYLSFLTDNGLLSYDAHTQTFKITEKGLRLLDAYNQMHDMIKAPV